MNNASEQKVRETKNKIKGGAYLVMALCRKLGTKSTVGAEDITKTEKKERRKSHVERSHREIRIDVGVHRTLHHARKQRRRRGSRYAPQSRPGFSCLSIYVLLRTPRTQHKGRRIKQCVRANWFRKTFGTFCDLQLIRAQIRGKAPFFS